MQFVDDLKRLLNTKPAETEFVYVFLPADLDPLERGERYADTLELELRGGGLGYVSGGGSSLGEEQADGTRPVEFCGIDIDAWDLQGTLELLRIRLPALGCPAGTQLHYRDGGAPLQDEYDGAGWMTAPRTMMHPAFGI